MEISESSWRITGFGAGCQLGVQVRTLLLSQVCSGRGLIVLQIRLRTGGTIVHGIAGHVVGLGGVRASDGNGPVGPPPFEFEMGQRQSAFQNAGVVRSLDILIEHVDEQGRLRSVQVIDASTIGDETKCLQLVHEILESGINNIVKF